MIINSKRNYLMKKSLLFSAILCCLLFTSRAQVLNVRNNEQEYNQWCWAACSKTILEYYGFDTTQCGIAEWVRATPKTWHDYGSVNCCTDASQGCNYWNYSWGEPGSIQEILVHFGNLQNTGVSAALTENEITADIQKNRLFVIRWGWVGTVNGHFIVGHGIKGDSIYFMNPWFGEGLHVGTYSFMLSGIDKTSTYTHEWTHTNRITSNVSAVSERSNEGTTLSVNPNPFFSETTLQSGRILKDATLTVYNSCGQAAKQIKHISGQSVTFHRDNLPCGIYFIRLEQDNNSFSAKLVIKDN